MLNGVEWSGSFATGGAVAVALVAALLVYRDARRHGSYHALSATGAVAIAGFVGYAVGGVVGLFVGTGYVLLLYLLSYPTTPSIDPRGPQGDAGENIASEEAADTLSVIRVEVATYETLQELAQRYDDVPDDAPEAELRSALRVKALSEVDEQVDGGGSDPGAADTRPNRGLSDPDAPTARASEYGIEEWSSDSTAQPTEQASDYDAAEWTADESGPAGPEDAAAWHSESTDGAATAEAATADPSVADDAPEQSPEPTATPPMSESNQRPTTTRERPEAALPDRNDELAEGAQSWVAENVDRDLGVTVGEALDTPDVYDDPDETQGEYSVGDWSDDEPPAETETANGTADWSAPEPPAETETDQSVADWSGRATATNDDGSSVAAEAEVETETEASTEADTAATGGVWDTAGQETEQPDSEQATGMVFDNAVERAETDGERTETEKPAKQSAAEDASASAQTTETEGAETNAESASQSENDSESSSGDDDPFDGRGELYDGDDTYEEEEETRY